MDEKEKLELKKFVSQRISKAVEDLYVDLRQMYNNDMDRPIDYCQGEFDAMVKLAKEITETVVWNLKQKADDWMIHRLQRNVANDLACAEMPYEKCLEVLQRYNMFSTWTIYEMNNRPVDIDEIREMVEQELGLF